MKLIYTAKISKQLAKLPKKSQIKILNKSASLKTDPFLGKQLKGEFAGLRSFRVWPYRIIYQLDKKRKTLFLLTVEHRQQAYK